MGQQRLCFLDPSALEEIAGRQIREVVGERSFEDIRPHIERVLSAASGSSTPHRCTSVGLATGGSTLCTRRRALLTGLSMAGLQESVISPNAERWSSRTQIWPPSSSHPTRKSDHFELRSRAPTGRPTASIPVALPFGFCTVLGRRRSAEVYRHGRASPRFVGMRRRSSSAQFTAMINRLAVACCSASIIMNC